MMNKYNLYESWKSVEAISNEGYGIGTSAGDIIWKHFNEVHSMDQDDVFCNHCGKMMTEPVRKAGIAGDGEGGLAQQQVYFDHLKQEHGITESKASEAESCKQCGRLGWSSDPKNCDDCSDPAGDGYEPDLDDTSASGELGTGLY